MDVMTLAQLGEKTNIDPQTLLAYRDAYLLFVPAIRVGQSVGFPAEAAEVFTSIDELTTGGKSQPEITALLIEQYPVTVIASQPITPTGVPAKQAPATPVTGLLKDVDKRYRDLNAGMSQIREELGKTASEERALQIQQMITGVASSTSKKLEPLGAISTELVQIRQAVGVLASRIDRQNASALESRSELAATIDAISNRLQQQHVPGITEELNEVRLELAELRSSLPETEPVSSSQLEQLTGDIASLKDQISDVRRERGQMISLMSALQDNLAQLHMELAEARNRSNGDYQPALHVVPMGAIGGNDTHDLDIGTGSLRTPRRLGHQGR
jgi:DNA repair exonuclease SbcCD ATPase subunit